LVSPTKAAGRLQSQCEIPDEYDLTLEAERLSGASELAIGFTWQGQPAVLVVDFAGQKTGFAGLGKPLHAKPVLPQSGLVSLLIQVRKGRLTVRADEWDLLTLEGDDKPPPVPERWRAATGGELFVSTSDSSIALHHWSLAKYIPAPPTAPPTSAGAAVAAGRPTVPLRPTASPVTRERGNPFKATTPGSSSTSTSTSASASDPNSAVAQPVAAAGEIAFRPLMDFPDKGWGVQCLAFSPDGRYLAAGKMDNQVWIFDLEKKQRVADTGRLKEMGSISAIGFTPQGDRLLAGGRSGIVQVWKFRDGAITAERQFAGHSSEVQVLKISADGKYALSGGRDNRPRYWEVATGREQFAYGGFSSSLKGAVLLAGGKEALATDGHTLLKLDLQAGSTTIVTDKLNSTSGVAAFSPDGQTLAVNFGYKVRFLRTSDGDELGEVDTKHVTWGLYFSPDGRYALSAGNEKLLCWDTSDWKPAGAVLVELNQNIKTAAYSPDGKRLATIGSNASSTLHLFNIVPPK
jgi:WD40 repeat protein